VAGITYRIRFHMIGEVAAMNLPTAWLNNDRFDDVVGPNALGHRAKFAALLQRSGGDPSVAARLPSWSWYGLLFGTGYLFYRKLWLPGTILLAIEIGASLLPPPASYVAWTLVALIMALWAEAWVLGRTHRLVSDSHLAGPALRQQGGVSLVIALVAVAMGTGATMLLHKIF